MVLSQRKVATRKGRVLTSSVRAAITSSSAENAFSLNLPFYYVCPEPVLEKLAIFKQSFDTCRVEWRKKEWRFRTDAARKLSGVADLASAARPVAAPPVLMRVPIPGRIPAPANILCMTTCPIQTGWSPHSERSFER